MGYSVREWCELARTVFADRHYVNLTFSWTFYFADRGERDVGQGAWRLSVQPGYDGKDCQSFDGVNPETCIRRCQDAQAGVKAQEPAPADGEGEDAATAALRESERDLHAAKAEEREVAL